MSTKRPRKKAERHFNACPLSSCDADTTHLAVADAIEYFSAAFESSSAESMMRRGFTVAEIVMVAGVFSLLACLAVPAIHQSREAARKTQCQDNLKRLGTALLSYHDAAGRFPVGVEWPAHQYSDPRATYMPRLFPYLGRADVYDLIDWNIRGTLWCRGNNLAAVRMALPELLCPSDGLGGSTKPNPYCGEHAMTNYMAFMGESIHDAYSDDFVFGANRSTSLDDIGDGTSHTLMMGEYLTGTPTDLRGSAWGDEAGAGFIFTGLTPNSHEPDRLYPNPRIWNAQDGRVNDPQRNLAFGYGDGFITDTVASRSRHAGGVHVLFRGWTCAVCQQRDRSKCVAATWDDRSRLTQVIDGGPRAREHNADSSSSTRSTRVRSAG